MHDSYCFQTSALRRRSSGVSASLIYSLLLFLNLTATSPYNTVSRTGAKDYDLTRTFTETGQDRLTSDITDEQ